MRPVEFALQLKAYVERVDQRLCELLPLDDSPNCLQEAMRYAALNPGKRIRPSLTLIAAEAVGGDSVKAALDAACAIELIHAFSLVHDDLPALDDDDLRRGKPTCHKVFGEAVAILAGDALFARAFDVMASLEMEPSRTIQAIKVLSRAAGLLVAGETTDILSEGQAVSAEVVERIHQQKTGALIAAAAEIGGIAGGGDAHQVEALHRYGSWVGLAFQIADDVLNETSTPEQLGKAAGSDRDRQKATYPSVFGIDASREMALSASQAGIAEIKDLPRQGLLCEIAEYAVARLH